MIGNWTANLWNPRKCLACANSVGVAGWEADLLICQPSGWVYEIEIKISVSDFRAEFKKKKEKHRDLQRGYSEWKSYSGMQRRDSIIRKYYFAMPFEIYEKVKNEIPEYAGVITFKEGHSNHFGVLYPSIQKQPLLLPGKKTGDATRKEIFTATYFAYWNREAK